MPLYHQPVRHLVMFPPKVVPGADHCRTYQQNPQEYVQRVLGFFNKYF